MKIIQRTETAQTLTRLAGPVLGTGPDKTVLIDIEIIQPIKRVDVTAWCWLCLPENLYDENAGFEYQTKKKILQSSQRSFWFVFLQCKCKFKLYKLLHQSDDTCPINAFNLQPTTSNEVKRPW